MNRSTRQSLIAAYGGFSRRFATGRNLVNLMLAIKDVLDRYGSIQDYFLSGMTDRSRHGSTRSDTICCCIYRRKELGHLMPLIERGSACKRLNLFLRWMVRRDDVDPGGWDQIPASKLIMRICGRRLKSPALSAK